MAMELVTGHAGAAHVSGADVGAFNAKTIGSGTYILDSELPALTMTDANTLTVPVCEVLAQGRYVRITAPESVTIESGSQAGYRNDIVFLRYTLESTTSVESVELVPVTGTTVASQSDVVDPTTEYSSASILDGATTVDIPFIRVSVVGLTPSAEWLLTQMASMQDIVEPPTTVNGWTVSTRPDGVRDAFKTMTATVSSNGVAHPNTQTHPFAGTPASRLSLSVSGGCEGYPQSHIGYTILSSNSVDTYGVARTSDSGKQFTFYVHIVCLP